MAINLKNLNFQKLVSELVGFDEYGIDQIRTVEWGRRYLWGIKFLSTTNSTAALPPAPFDSFFPASDVEFPVSVLDSYSFEYAQSSYKIPKQSSVKQISITFFDDTESKLMRWLKDWVEIDLLNFGNFVSCLEDDHKISDIRLGATDSFGNDRQIAPVRTVEIQQLSPSFEPTGLKFLFDIYPEGEINFSGTSASEANTYAINFVVVGEKSTNNIDDRTPTKKLKDLGIKTLGRFI